MESIERAVRRDAEQSDRDARAPLFQLHRSAKLLERDCVRSTSRSTQIERWRLGSSFTASCCGWSSTPLRSRVEVVNAPATLRCSASAFPAAKALDNSTVARYSPGDFLA